MAEALRCAPMLMRWDKPGPSATTLIGPRDRVYEVVLREGTDEDVPRFIDVEVLANGGMS